jgi:Ca2+/H+ antiporter, TMEM165/GDT1 family
MSAFFLAFLATALVIAAGRDALFVARLSQAHGRASGLHIAIVLAALAFATVPVWLAGSVTALLDGAAERLFVAVALLVAGAELLLLRAAPRPAEPTQSTAATVVVLAVQLVSGASGFLLLALAARGTAPAAFTAAGGLLGALAVLPTAAIAGADWERLPLGIVRTGVGLALLLAAIVIGFIAVT